MALEIPILAFCPASCDKGSSATIHHYAPDKGIFECVWGGSIFSWPLFGTLVLGKTYLIGWKYKSTTPQTQKLMVWRCLSFSKGPFSDFALVFRGCNGKLVVWAGVILGVPLSNNPFHKGILAIQTTNLPSIKQSRVWGDTPADPDVVIGSRGIPITARIIPTYSNILLSSADVLFVTIRSARIPIMKHYSLYGNSIMFHYLAKQKRITISHSLKPSA